MDSSRNNSFLRPHAFSAFRSAAVQQQPVGDDNNLSQSSQLDSQMIDLPFQDEVVPNSQTFPSSVLPYGNTFQSLMHAALFEPPPPQAPATSMARPPVAGRPALPSPAIVHPPATQEPQQTQPSPSTRVAAPSTDAPPARKRKSNEIWSSLETSILLDFYEDKWISLNRGNFKAKHWADIARELNAKCGTDFTDTQCKNKWENLRKTFMKERQKESSSGAEPSRWEHFGRMSDLLNGTPKVSGLQGGYSGEDFVSPEVVSLAEDEDMAAEDEAADPTPTNAVPDEGTPLADSQPSKPTDNNVDDVAPSVATAQQVRGHKTKKKKSSASSDGLGVSMERSIGAFAAAFKEVELKRMETQLEIARLLAPPRDTPSEQN